MSQPKKPSPDPRKVWRITGAAPLGEVVTVAPAGSTTAERPAPEPGADLSVRRKSVRYWRASSYDLLTGLDVRDFADTVPSELLDELFKQ